MTEAFKDLIIIWSCIIIGWIALGWLVARLFGEMANENTKRDNMPKM
jgi:hypothetical protein